MAYRILHSLGAADAVTATEMAERQDLIAFTV
jgi:hypothetical protein